MKLFKHLKTVHTHRKAVRKLCFKCGLYKQGLVHDLSKYSPEEFFYSVKYWTGDHSPIENQIDDIGYSEAWLHHVGRNKHHFEHWVDLAHEGRNGEFCIICEMPLKYIAEMFCDRVGASKAYLWDKYTNDSPLKYAQKGEERNQKLMTKRVHDILYGWLGDLAEFGEDYICDKIKKVLRGK